MALSETRYKKSFDIETLDNQGELIDAIVMVTFHYDEPDMSVGYYGGCVIDDVECTQDIDWSELDLNYLTELCDDYYRDNIKFPDCILVFG